MSTILAEALDAAPEALTPGGATLDNIRDEILELYCADQRPWVIGYSGGKDSTAILRLVYEALASAPPARRTKPVFIVSSDTLVETPVVVNLIGETLATVQAAAAHAQLPITAA